jgi:hydroxypyruvate reductase
MIEPRFDEREEHAGRLIAAALEAADPARALARHWDESLDDTPCVVLAVGKASIAMAREALARLRRVRRTLVTAPPDQGEGVGPGVRVMVCDHPFPTGRNVEAAMEVAGLMSRIAPDETLLVLMSGGGSAHLTLPAGDLTVQEIAAITKALQWAGATIAELNCVRKHCELLKGGRLAARCAAGRVMAFILSDVLGDRLDVIASGPTAPDPTTYEQALHVLERFDLLERAPAVTAHLRRGAAGEFGDTPKESDRVFQRVTNTIIASNRVVVDAVAEAAREIGFEIAGVEHGVEGEAAEVGRRIAARLGGMTPGSCWIVGGETTVNVGAGRGVGGPSQELALSAAAELDGVPGACILTFSTDGRDGPTEAAGGLVTGETCARARGLGLDVQGALEEHDSFGLLGRIEALVRVAPTGTNLNHVAVLMRYE